jgi:hypothetical protein
MHIVSKRLLSKQRSPRLLLALSIWHVHERRRIEKHRRLHTCLRLRHLFAHRTGTVSRVSQEQLQRRATDGRLQELPNVSGGHIHLPTSRPRQGEVSGQMLPRNVLRHGTLALRPVPQGLLPTPARRHYVQRVPHQHVHRQIRGRRPRRMQARPMHRQRLPTRWTLRTHGPRSPVLLPRWILR